VYATIARHNDFSWRRHLPRAKFRRGFRGRKSGSPASFIRNRAPLARRPQNKTAALVADMLCDLMRPLPACLRKTVTFDNGTEFAHHDKLNSVVAGTFFCDTRSPWQKGGVENAIGRMRRFLPRKTDLTQITDEQFDALIAIYNNTPRKCLGYKTPAEVFLSQLLRFKCESTSRPSPG
jgi:IS30 family transposase